MRRRRPVVFVESLESRLLLTAQIQLSYHGTGITDGQGTAIDLGQINQQSNEQVTFSVMNAGDTDLHPGSVSLPAGYSVATALPGAISPGTSQDLVLSLDTSTLATRAGTVGI